jgi:hypothetical protein
MWLTRFAVFAALLTLTACGPMPYYSNYPRDISNIDRPVSGPTLGFGAGAGH